MVHTGFSPEKTGVKFYLLQKNRVCTVIVRKYSMFVSELNRLVFAVYIEVELLV